MHKSHLIGCAAGIAIALALVAFSGGSAGSIGVLGAALLCPVLMIGAMWFLMRSMNQQPHTHEQTPPVHYHLDDPVDGPVR